MLRRLLVILVLCLLHGACVAVAQPTDMAGKVFSFQGNVEVLRAGSAVAVSEGMALQGGDEVIVGEPGRIAVELLDGSYVRLASGSRMKLPGLDNRIGLFEGALHFLSHSEKHPTIETSTVTAAIRGTEFTLVADRSNTTISMFSGSVEGQSSTGRASLGAGQGAHFRKGKAPEVFAILANERSVQWSMFVPFAGDVQGGNAAKASALYREGKTTQALKMLSKAGNDPCDADAVLRGRILVSAGDPEAGAAVLARCAASSKESKNRSSAQAALSTVRLMQGERAEAAVLADKALEADASSPGARLAQSFVYQERGDLDRALAVIESGELSSPDLVARRAELLFMFGRVPEAREILAGMAQRSWYAETVYGFVLMADRDFDAAREAFDKAAAEEPGAGLPRLGLGIIKVNKGELEDARKEFERATVLEPSRALYRSYLGKDYFEDDTYDKAEPEYQRAIELDPNDPTPYLYRSFMRVAQNDLVGGLDDINKARELSGARDVYRSSFLLDQDSAMQSASVGRVYQQLGFKERGRIEAITAITQDYRNATAHRLLSQTQEDIFAADTIASEQRIANLFSPLSVNVVDSIGTGVSLNEYSQLFERDGWRTAINSGFDSKSDFFRSGVLSTYKKENIVVGLSADGAAYNGIADDPRSSAGTVGFSLQAQPNWADRLLFEGRGLSSGNTTQEESVDALNGTLNAAYLHKFSPEVSTVIQSSYDRFRTNTNRPFYDQNIGYTTIENGVQNTDLFLVPLDQRSKRYETSVVNEAQLLAKYGAVNSILTLRNSNSDIDSYDRSVATLDPDTGDTTLFQSTGPVNVNGSSVSYLGDYVVTNALHLNFGGEYEHVEWADRDEAPFNSERAGRDLLSPKAGFVYRPDETVALRAGYGESLGKGTRTDLISVEPTMIGGITQRYNDLPGIRSQNLGFGADFKTFEDTYFGAEWTRRWLDESQAVSVYNIVDDFDSGQTFNDVANAPRSDQPIGQDFISSYLYHVLDRHWVTGTDYRYVGQQMSGDLSSESRDHRGTAFTRYFFTGGFFLQGSTTYRYQFRNNVETDAGDSPNGSDNAWLFGAGVGYRLPTRQGMLMLDVQNIFGQDITLSQLSYFNEPVFNDPTVRLSANFNF